MMNFLRFFTDVVFSLILLTARFFFERKPVHKSAPYIYPLVSIRRDYLGKEELQLFHLDAVKWRFGKLKTTVSKRQLAKILTKGMSAKKKFITLPAPWTHSVAPSPKITQKNMSLSSTVIPTTDIHDIAVDFLPAVHLYTARKFPLAVYVAVIAAGLYMIFDVLSGLGVL